MFSFDVFKMNKNVFQIKYGHATDVKTISNISF